MASFAQPSSWSLADSVFEVPLPCPHLRSLKVLREVFSDLDLQGVLEVGTRHEHLQGDQHLGDQECRAPLVLKDVQADAAKLVDVRVVDFGAEQTLGRNHWVLRREVNFYLVFSTLVDCLCWTIKLHEEMQYVVVLDLSGDAWRRILEKLSNFLRNSCDIWMGGGRPCFSLHFLI